ncbi:MAG: site-specific DNA-methyltransferase [Gammaproteobacteria bacterium]|nr:site-specific DNA-methyltransferase [Gammaproteobacteria bacterium]
MKITNEDNMQMMARYDDNHFDLAIVDPPFGIGNFVQTNNRGDKVEWNESSPSEEYFTELKRVSKNRIIFGANYFNCFEEKGGAIVWIKNQPMPNFSKCVIASCSFHKKTELYTQTWTNFKAKDRVGIHPCEMPVSIYEWILMNYAKDGDKILDTHLGSGSIAIACHNLGFDLTACELDKEYYDKAMKRLKHHESQLRLL